MNRSCRCNELRKTTKAKHDTIEFRFVNTDSNTPAFVRISLGDTDPLTGKPIEEIRFFREYNLLSNRQAACNDKNIREGFSKEEKTARDRLRSSIAEAFEQEYGYEPSGETLRYLLEEQWPIPYVLPIDNQNDEEEEFGDSDLDLTDPSAEAAFPGNESDDTEALRDFEQTLSGRLLDVYRMMLDLVDAGFDPPLLKELARKWSVTPSCISKDQAVIRQMILDYSTNVRRFSYDRR